MQAYFIRSGKNIIFYFDRYQKHGRTGTKYKNDYRLKYHSNIIFHLKSNQLGLKSADGLDCPNSAPIYNV